MKSYRNSWLTWLLVCGSFVASTRAATFYIASNGNDNNLGTQAAPFRQISRGLASLQAGDTLLVGDGSYLGFTAERLRGTSAAPITIKALGAAAVITVTTDRPDNRDTIFICDCEHLVVDGLRASGANRAALRIQDGHHITVRRCVFIDNQRWGILTGQSDDLLIEENECAGSLIEHGIYVANSGDRPIVRRNVVYSNARSGIQLNADVNTPPGDGIISNAVVEDNLIYNNGGGSGIAAGGGAAINLDGVQDSLIRNNLLYNNRASGIIMYQIDGAEGPRGNRVIHNTVDMPNNGRWALGIVNTSGSNFVRNNVLLNRHSFRGSIQFGTPQDAANTDSDYNLLGYLSDDDATTRISLETWHAMHPLREAHSLSTTTSGALTSGAAAAAIAATTFVTPAAANTDLEACYLLRLGVNVINAGTTLTPAVGPDFEGTSRQLNAPDIGCYEASALALDLLHTAEGRSLVLRGGASPRYRLDQSTNLTVWSFGPERPRTGRRVALPMPMLAERLFFRGQGQP